MRDYAILGACNPEMAWQAIEHEPKIGTMLPRSVIVRGLEDGRVEVSAARRFDKRRQRFGQCSVVNSSHIDRVADVMKETLRVAAAILSTIAFMPGDARAQRPAFTEDIGRLELGTLERDAGVRTWWVYLPSNYDTSGNWPAVLVFHGGGGRGRRIMADGRWRELAEAEGFIAVFPDGTSEDMHLPIRYRRAGQTWNDGSGRSSIDAVQRNIDDVAFVNAVVDDLLAEYAIDPDLVFAAGHSNGGSMTFHAARGLDGRFAAIAPVAGADFAGSDPDPVQPVSMVYITGTRDPLNPIDGGTVFIPPFIGPFEKPAVVPMVERWATAQQCSAQPEVSETVDRVETRTWNGCAGGARVVLHLIDGHGHTWPGAESDLPAFLVGPNDSPVSATEVIWEFFDAVISN